MAMETGRTQRVDFTETITVVVGEGEKEYLVHKSYATKTSDFFKSATTGDWKEGKLARVPLPNHSPDEFEFYIHWLYTGNIPIDDTTATIHSRKARAYSTKQYELLMNLYVIGYYLLDTAFRNAVVTAVFEMKFKLAFFPGPASINALWDKAPADCPMKQLIVMLWAVCGEEAFMTENLPVDFLVDLLRGMVQIRDAKANGGMFKYPTWSNRCDYHEHNEKNPVCAQGDPESPESSLKPHTTEKTGSARIVKLPWRPAGRYLKQAT